MAIVRDNFSLTTLQDASVSTDQLVSYTVGSGSNTVLLVFFQYSASASGGGITSVTYNGVSLTQYHSNSVNFAPQPATQEIWYLVNPATGVNNIEIKLNAAIFTSGIKMASVSYFGVDQTTIFDSPVLITQITTSGSTFTSGNAVTTVDKDFLLVYYYAYSGGVTYTQNDGTIVGQGTTPDGRNHAFVEKASLTPTGTYTTTINCTSGGQEFAMSALILPSTSASSDNSLFFGY